MNASTWNQVVISDAMEELVKASIAPSTVKTYRLAMQQLETAPTKYGERKCLFIFMIHYKYNFFVFTG